MGLRWYGHTLYNYNATLRLVMGKGESYRIVIPPLWVLWSETECYRDITSYSFSNWIGFRHFRVEF